MKNKRNLCPMNWFKKQWELFKSKSAFGKFWDVLFVLIIVALIFPDGRLMVQKLILKTGIMGSTKANLQEELSANALDWKLTDSSGAIYTLNDFSGKPVFINFWATWCPPCRAEMPSILELMKKTGDNATFIFITNESPEKVEPFLKKQGWDLPVYYPAENAPKVFQAKSLPTTVVISKNGEIIHRSEGMRDWDNDKAVELLTP
jgi:thiol-disulfide isomerase/thioredoxin